MITAKEARQVIDNVGIKHRQFAKAVNVNHIWLSEWLNHKRLLDPDRLLRIDAYCNKLRAVIPQ